MSEIVNLRAVRKTRARAEARRQADANAALHGRTRAQRAAEEAERITAARRLDGHRRTGDDDRSASDAPDDPT
ncbi:MAG: DUF4169 family protein [Gemmobacter sp.]